MSTQRSPTLTGVITPSTVGVMTPTDRFRLTRGKLGAAQRRLWDLLHCDDLAPDDAATIQSALDVIERLAREVKV